jgi:hypothetical protein
VRKTALPIEHELAAANDKVAGLIERCNYLESSRKVEYKARLNAVQDIGRAQGFADDA